MHQLPDKFRVTIGAVQVRPFLQAFVENGFRFFIDSISFKIVTMHEVDDNRSETIGTSKLKIPRQMINENTIFQQKFVIANSTTKGNLKLP